VWTTSRREYYRGKAKEYRQADPEKYRARAKQNYQKFRSERLAHGKIAYQATRQTSPWSTLVDSAKARAKDKAIPFDLTKEWAAARWTGRCEITNIPFVIGARGLGPKPLAGTIDRVDPKLGYVQSNCRFILQAVNALKSTMTDAEMIVVARAIIENYAP
jgi:hypothetical protein